MHKSSKGGQAKLKSQSKSRYSPIRILGTFHTKIIAGVTYELYFRPSLYV
jgi:hypothetical protein